MKWKFILFVLVSFFLGLQCAEQKNLTSSESDRIRMLHPFEIASFHDPVKLEVAWVPYQEHKLVKTKKNEWKVVKSDSDTKPAAMPQILLTYPQGTDTLWLDMNTDNAILGKLLKHSLMTQQPISRPFTTYFETAACATCHPQEIEIDFE